MLIAIVEAIACENPRCSEFGKLVDMPRGKRSYYCQTCGKTSRARGVDAAVLASPEKYRDFLASFVREGRGS